MSRQSKAARRRQRREFRRYQLLKVARLNAHSEEVPDSSVVYVPKRRADGSDGYFYVGTVGEIRAIRRALAEADPAIYADRYEEAAPALERVEAD